MAYDQFMIAVVLFGGKDATASNNEIWSFDQATSTWMNLKPIDPLPSARSGSSLIFSEASSKLILFGGLLGTGEVAQDAWTFEMSETSTITEETLPETEDPPVIGGTTTTSTLPQ
jgi:hypothetical protein